MTTIKKGQIYAVRSGEYHTLKIENTTLTKVTYGIYRNGFQTEQHTISKSRLKNKLKAWYTKLN